MSGLFEHLAATDDSYRVNARKALALARARADRRFASFINNGDREARLALVAGDLTDTVRQACADVEYDDWEGVLAAVQTHLGFTVESRKPKMCPFHREVTDISLSQGDPQAGFAAMAQHTFGENSCRGTWEGGHRCNFKPEMTTQTYWDDKAEKAEERRLERERQREQMENGDGWDNEGGGQPKEDRPEQPEPDELGGVPPSQPEPVATPDDAQVPEPDNFVAEPQMAMAAHTAEALKTVDLNAGSDTPIPKMDKSKWTPENVRFLDVEMDGSPHPTRHQDIAAPAVYKSIDAGDDDGRFEQTNAVLEKQDVEKDSNPTDGGQPSGTFPSGGGSAVSKVAGESCPSCGQPTFNGSTCSNCGFQDVRRPHSAVDPDLNPIAEFVAEEELQRALEEFNVRS